MNDNSLYKLHDILMDQIKNVTSQGLTGEKLNETLRVSAALQGLAQIAVTNAALTLKANLMVGNSIAEVQMPKMIEAPPQKVLEAPQASPSRKQAAIDPPKALNG